MKSANSSTFSIKNYVKKGLTFASLEPVKFGDWIVKASSCSHGGVLVIMNNINSYDSFTRYFDCELKANLFITYVIESGTSDV